MRSIVWKYYGMWWNWITHDQVKKQLPSSMNSDAMDAATKPWNIWTFASQNKKGIIALICSDELRSSVGYGLRLINGKP